MNQCPKCYQIEEQMKDGFTPAGSQRIRCKHCRCRYTPLEKTHGYGDEIRLQAFALHLEGVSLRKIGRLLSVNHQSVANWVKAYANHMPSDLPPSILDISELDGV